ncbi:GNAT family N-acetyltransferase [Paenibacillus donghaensis]|uniref:GNAT family N-acetyltransferase n=1 Tax=Paenibacillus donghaensis TaxID=414771 RepID=UPI0018846F98|nr:GNAT family N-acetyltransferase [Paenibacillus donghaensis]MBE9917542.1 GNAT family N-acetyltransferase [Paenibacillus donghaensis]
MSKWTIREAETKDIHGLAHVHLNSWLTTYRGIVPDTYLDNMKLESRIELWTRVLDPSNKSMTFVLENRSGEIAGFINGGASREKGFDIEAEVYSLYLLKEAQGKGYGRELMNRMIGYFREQGYRSMLVWVLEDNPALQFYQKMGGRFLTRDLLEIGGEHVKDLCLEWRNLDELS